MSFVIQKRPKQYSSVLQPIIYTGQRQDQAFNTVTNNGGTIRITVTGIDVTANYTVDDQVYVKSTDGRYDALGAVTARVFGANTTIDVDIVYTANATVGFINNITSRPVYKIRVNYKDPVTNLSLLSNSLDFAANTKGVVTIDARIVATLIGAQIDSIAPYLVATTDTLRSIQFYIGYTEIWTGSAEAETNDTAFPKYAIFGDQEVNGFNDYLTRIPERFLSVASKLRAYIGKYFDLSYFGLTTADAITIEHYAVDGSLTATDAAITAAAGLYRIPALPATTDAKLIYKIAHTITIPVGTSWLDVASGLALTKGASTLSAAVTPAGLKSYRGRTPVVGIDLSSFTTLNFTLTLTGVWTGTVNSIEIRIVDRNGNYRTVSATGMTVNGATPLALSTSSTLVSAGSELNIESVYVILNATATSGTMNAALTIPNGVTTVVQLSSQEVEVADSCDRPVTIGWINRLGGIDWWTFDYDQDLSYTSGDDRKIRRIRLREENVNYEQWQMLNGINTIGDLYEQSYPELTLQVKGRQKRIGAQAYLLLDDYSLLEVVAIFTSQTTQTRQVGNSTDVTIEFPEGFEGNNFFGISTGRAKRFLTQFTNTLPTNEWEVYWFGGVTQNVQVNGTYTKTLQLPAEPYDVIIKARKVSNNGIAQAAGTVTLTKDGVSYPTQNITFAKGDDLSDLSFYVTAVTAAAAFPNDRINIIITE